MFFTVNCKRSYKLVILSMHKNELNFLQLLSIIRLLVFKNLIYLYKFIKYDLLCQCFYLILYIHLTQ